MCFGTQEYGRQLLRKYGVEQAGFYQRNRHRIIGGLFFLVGVLIGVILL